VNRLLKSNRLGMLVMLADALVFTSIWFGTYLLRDFLAYRGYVRVPINPIRSYQLALLVYLPFWALCCWYYGLYTFRGKITGLNQASALVKTFLAGLVGSLAIAYLFKQWDIGRFVLLLSAALFSVWLYLSRTALRSWKQAKIRQGVGVTNVLVVGIGRTARRVMSRIVNHPEGGYRFVGFVDPRMRRTRVETIEEQRVVGHAGELSQILERHPVDEVFLAVPRMPQKEVLNLVSACEHHGVQFNIVSNLFEVITSQVQIDVIDEVPVVHLRNAQLTPLHAFLKRTMDIVVASGLLLVTGLFLLVIALLIRLDSPGGALFTQERVGKAGRRFRLFKFRTMRTDADPYSVAPTDPDDSRITRLGRFLRRTSIDEFPQLINVLRGEMSMVGPRPEMPFLVDKYEEWQRRRLDVKPGVTGLWQIVGRKNLPLSLNMEYDFYYIKNQSLLFDMVILLKTIPAVIFGRGAF
jgi:exopolysaccharide biosynthesis polyprenyl glycosylphosphotransferase